MRKLLLILIPCAIIIFIANYYINKPKSISVYDTKDAEIDSLLEVIEYYKDREQMFLNNNGALYEKVADLENQMRRTPAPVHTKTTKNEKNPLISTSESKYFNELLSRRYQDKP